MTSPRKDPTRVPPQESGDAERPAPGSGAEDFQELFDHLPDPAFIFSKETFEILAVNDAARRRYGWTREEFLAMSMTDIRPDGERDRFLERMKSLPPRRELRGETRHRTKDGSEFVVDVDARDIRIGGRACRFVSARDAFERKMAWTALQETQDTYSGLVEMLAEGVAILDEDGRFIYVNSACGRVFGLEGDALLGRTTLDFVPPGERQESVDQLRKRIRSEQAPVEMEILRADGERRWIAVRAAPRKDSSGQFAGTVASFFDVTEHRRALEALQQSETRFRRLIEMLPQGLVTYQDGRITYSNPAAAAITRTDPAKTHGKPILDFIHPSHWDDIRTRFARLAKGEPVPAMDYTFVRSDGTPVQVEAHARILEPGERPVMVSVFTDLTRRLDMERAIREQEQLLQLVSEQTGQLLYDLDLASGRVRFMGPVQEILGLEEGVSAMDVMDWGRRLHPDDIERESLKLEQARERLQPLITEYRLRRGDGVHIPVEDHGIFLPGPDGRAARMIGVIRDISARYAAEQALRDSEERYRSVVEQAQDMIFLVDADTRAISQANQAFHQTLGYSGARMAGLTLYDLVDGDRESIDRNIAMVQRKGSTSIGRRIYRHADGSRREVEVSGSFCRAAGQEFMVVLARDITDRLATERALQQTQKLESLGVLAGGIAHDFNNLLTAMMGNLSLAQLKSHPSSPSWPYLDALEKSIQRAADLTRQMLAYSGKGRFVTRTLDLNHTVEEMTHLLSVSIPKGISLRFHLAQGLPPLVADPAQLQQVVMNLVTNAADAIGEAEGVIGIRTGLVEIGEADLARDFPAQAMEPGPYLALEVSDSGCGMDPETLGRIFEPFFTTKLKGRGLGLSAMLGILRGHRGGIRIQSAPGEGTTFRIYLPARPGAEGAAPEAGSSLSLRPEGAVLVVDDESDIRSGAKELFHALGFDLVLEAADGAEAVEIFKARHGGISLVFMDLTMPRMNGHQAFKAMRRIDASVPVILSSGFDQVADATPGDEPAAFLQKPYRMKQLRSTVMEVLEKARRP